MALRDVSPLALLYQRLSDDGSFWMSIDDNEVPHARAVLNEIFGENNIVIALTWQKRVSPANDVKYFSSDHEYVLVFAKSKDPFLSTLFPQDLPSLPRRIPADTLSSGSYTRPGKFPA